MQSLTVFSSLMTRISGLKNLGNHSKYSFATAMASECLSDGTTSNLVDAGPHEYEILKDPSYTLYMPQNLPSGCLPPVVVFGVGTMMPASLYTHIYKHLASHGFAVVANRSTITILGRSMRRSLSSVLKKYEGQVLPRAGAIGHSQGGAGAFNTRFHKAVDTVVSIFPGQFPSLGNNDINYLGIAAGLDMFSVLTDPSLLHYRQVTGPKFYGKLMTALHTSSAIFSSSQQAKQIKEISTAWFMCHLKDDERACNRFTQDSCSAFTGSWVGCKSNL